ncbi:MAG: peptidylprolyl isomerase [Planctomycetes bacterium]|nr:peptidylprolyl isomerase [Planctomycetota bacterium]
MKPLITRACAGVLIALTAGTVGWYAGAQDVEAPPRTLKVNQVARVGQEVISAEQFIQRLVERERLYYQDPDLRTAEWALHSLVIDELMRLEAERLEAPVKRRELDTEQEKLLADFELEFKTVNEQIIKAQRARGSAEKAYTRDEYLLAKFDMTYDQFKNIKREQAKQLLTTRMVVNYWKLSSRSADVEGVFCRSREDAVKARARIAKGEDISIVAGEMSEDLHSREGGGFLGTAYPQDGSLRPAVETVLWGLEVGEISQPVEVDNGFWVIRKRHEQLANEAPFYDQREKCIAGTNPDNALMLKWRHAVVAGGLYKFERRMPGWDVKPGEE